MVPGAQRASNALPREADPRKWAKALSGIALTHIAYVDMGRDRTENLIAPSLPSKRC